mmetsp:Transcript_3430/g.7417  ORF Transcript_3430/g.7417 Transcript_3430/m.7417 type:complete len:238 (-) Transcript_3430:2332-3045(-)
MGDDAGSVGSVKRKFSFERMLQCFEAIRFARSTAASEHDNHTPGLPLAEPFLDAMDEVTLLFDHLGTGFGFVRADVESKTAIMRGHIVNHDGPESDSATPLEDLVQGEISARTIVHNKPPLGPSAGRTLLRLMWATKFLSVLMEELAKAYTPGSKLTLKACVSKAYNEALAEHHARAIRLGVSVAVNLLPNKDSFVANLGVAVERRDEYLARVQRSFGPLVARMYSYYERENLLTLP